MSMDEAEKVFNELIRPVDVVELTNKYKDGDIVEDIVAETLRLTTTLLMKRFIPIEGMTYGDKKVYMRI